MGRMVEKYYSVQELAWHLSFAVSTVRGWIKRGEFGPRGAMLELGTDLRVPASAVGAFVERHLSRHDGARARADLARGRTLGEARRRAQAPMPSPMESGVCSREEDDSHG